MKINIPKVITPVSMAEYAPELDGKKLYVWVNPPMDKLHGYTDLVTALQAVELDAARKVLSDGPDEPKGRAQGLPLQRTFDALLRWLKAKEQKKTDSVDEKLLDWYAEIWSQGPEDSRWTIDELRTLEAQDPAFLSWMITQTWLARSEHVERKKKV